MIHKGLAAVAVLLLLAQPHSAGWAQTPAAGRGSSHNAPSSPLLPRQSLPAGEPAPPAPKPLTVPQATPQPANHPPDGSPQRPAEPAATGQAAPAVQPDNAAPPAGSDCLGPDCDLQPQHISIATPAPAPAPWTWQERVTWAANLVLVVLGYAAILMALALLRKIERQTRYTEAAAQAAQESAQAALAQSQALLRADRPWLAMTLLPSSTVEDGFILMASNRGRGPARIVSTVHDIVFLPDESKLPATPEYRNQPLKPAEPRILLPGESTEILTFGREDAQKVCESEDQFAKVENWEEKIYLYGAVAYRDLAAPDEAPPHETSWFCWYIHGRQKSGMVLTGPPAYNRHS